MGRQNMHAKQATSQGHIWLLAAMLFDDVHLDIY